MPTEEPVVEKMDLFPGHVKSEPRELDDSAMDIDTALPVSDIQTPSPLAQPPADEQADAPVAKVCGEDPGVRGEEPGAPQPQGPNSTADPHQPATAASNPEETRGEADAEQQANGKVDVAPGQANPEPQVSEATVSAATDEAENGDGGDGEASSRPNVDYSDFLQQQYNDLMQRLREYKAKHGDVNVPRDYPEDPKLGAWVSEQRDRGRKGALPKDRCFAMDTHSHQLTIDPTQSFCPSEFEAFQTPHSGRVISNEPPGLSRDLFTECLSRTLREAPVHWSSCPS